MNLLKCLHALKKGSKIQFKFSVSTRSLNAFLLIVLPGWIIQKGKEEELAKEAVLEYCVQRLLQELKLM